MKKQILLTNYYTMTTIKVTSESFYSITLIPQHYYKIFFLST